LPLPLSLKKANSVEARSKFDSHRLSGSREQAAEGVCFLRRLIL